MIYLTNTRLDILYDVSVFSKLTSDPFKFHYAKILIYLQRTKNFVFKYTAEETMHSPATPTVTGHDVSVIATALYECIHSGIEGDILVLKKAADSSIVIRRSRIHVNYKCRM